MMKCTHYHLLVKFLKFPRFKEGIVHLGSLRCSKKVLNKGVHKGSTKTSNFLFHFLVIFQTPKSCLKIVQICHVSFVKKRVWKVIIY
jgi:hypothetical protein